MTKRLLDERVVVWKECSAVVTRAVSDIVNTLNTQYNTSGFFSKDVNGLKKSGLSDEFPTETYYNIVFNNDPSRDDMFSTDDTVVAEVSIVDDHIRITVPGGYYKIVEISEHLSAGTISKYIEEGIASSLSFDVLKELKAIL